MATVVLENIALNIASELIVKAVILGIRICQDAKVYVKEGKDFTLRLKVQIAIWQAIEKKFRDPEIQKRIRATDLCLYYDIMKQLHGLLQKYVERKFEAGDEKTRLLKDTSADDFYKKVEAQNILGKISTKEKEQSFGFWWRLKEEVAWTVWRKGTNEKLLNTIEAWGSRLKDFTDQTIPSMFPGATTEVIQQHIVDPTGSLDSTNFKSRIIMARSGTTTAIGGLGAIGWVEEEPFRLDLKRVELCGKGFSRPPTPGPITIGDMKSERDQRTELGGRERRQWGYLKDKHLKNPTPVIVEFKARRFSAPKDVRGFPTNYDPTRELDNLVRTLRLAAQKPESFRVLYCEGWYEETSHYGLVYRLPQTNNIRCESLGNILLDSKYRALLYGDLQNRLSLSKALAWTLFELHSVDWVHESLHPDNILLFGEQIGNHVHFDWNRPYVVGFDSSRSDTAFSGPYNPRAQWTARLYTHPDRQTGEYVRFKKTHDIYSLGVVLLEVGRLSSFMEDGQNEKWNFRILPPQLKINFTEEAMNLQTVLGSTFREIVLACLNGQFVDSAREYLLTGEFRTQVCNKLDQIRISLSN